MKKTIAWALRAVCAVCFGLQTAVLQAALQPVGNAPLASEYQQSCQLNQDGSTDCTFETRITVLKPAGRELVSKFEFNYPDTNRFEILQAEIVSPNGQKMPLPKSNIDTREAPQPAEGFARNKQTSFFFPKIEVGSTLIYKTRQQYAAKPLVDQASFEQYIFPDRERTDRYTMTFTSDRPLVWRSEAMDDFTITLSADKKRLVVEQKAPRYIYYVNEPPNGYIRRIPRIVVGTSEKVQDYLGAVARRYNQILTAPLPSAAASAVQAVKGKSPSEQVASLMEHIHTHYRYLGDWRPSTRGHIPFSLAEIETHGYGDCKDLAILLAAMLRNAGIQAEPAIVYRGNFARPLLLPIPDAANHVIVRAQFGDQVWWLDPTNPAFIPNYTMTDLQDRWAWVIDENGQIQQTHIPAEAPVKSFMHRLQRFKPDGSADVQNQGHLDVDMVFDITVADRQQGPQSVNQDFFCEQMGNEPVNCTVKRPETTFQVPAKYLVTVTALDKRAVEEASGQFVYDGKGSNTLWDDFDTYLRTQALSDLYLNDAHKQEYRAQLKNIWPQQPPKPCTVRSQWFDVDLEWTPESDGLSYLYREVKKVRWLNHDEIVSAPFKKMTAETRQCLKQLRFAVRLEKDKKQSAKSR